MPRKIEKESAEWRYIAELMAELGLEAGTGMCHLLFDMHYMSAHINHTLYTRMRERIDAHLDLCETAVYSYAKFFDTPGKVDTRILAALFLALEAEEEGR